MLAVGGLEEEDCSGLGNGEGFPERGNFGEGPTRLDPDGEGQRRWKGAHLYPIE